MVIQGSLGRRSFLELCLDPDTPRERHPALLLFAMMDEIEPSGFPSTSDQIATDLGAHLRCCNCDKELIKADLYCSNFCREITKHIRYIRNVTATSRLYDSDIQEAVSVKLLILTGGGYPQKERMLTPARRSEILERDSYTCRICGARADTIDHISGSSDGSDNLRALCRDCNRRESFRKAVPAIGERAEEIRRLYWEIAERVAVTSPLKLCDSEQWTTVARHKSRPPLGGAARAPPSFTCSRLTSVMPGRR
jgi:hypothetical protein